MKINWVSYYLQHNGFGRSSSRMVNALQIFNVDIRHLTTGDLERPEWMLRQMSVSWDNLSISYLDLSSLVKVPGRHWLFTMCEGNKLAPYTINKIKKSWAERLIVPSEFCAEAFRESGIKIPISVVLLGTDSEEFYPVAREDRPYTFLTLADRGDRKGWHEVYQAFYKAFGGKTTGDKDVRLIIKSLPRSNPMLTKISKATDWDERIKIDMQEYPYIQDFYSQGDCLALPSRSEGWGMPHREAAMMGLPVLAQKNTGLDDGHFDEWAISVPMSRVEDINDWSRLGGGGTWEIANVNRMAEQMRDLYENPEEGIEFGLKARRWLSGNQTWIDAAAHLIELIHDEDVNHGNEVENSTVYAPSRNGGGIRRTSSDFGKIRSYQTS